MSTSSCMQNKKPLYLEDMAVGLAFTSAAHLVDEKQIIDFANQFDPQPFHQDPEVARHSFFGGLIASGWHTAAITMRLMVESFPIAGGLIGAGGAASWPQPTRPGDIIHVEGQAIAVDPSRSRPDRGIVTIEAQTLTDRGEVLQLLTAKLVVFRKNQNNAA